ncbi:MAG: extracellular solute-binding protein [Acholeplasmataceae bacterium]|nr:extracellular solute-binding protein [Acholeplasmataceae bacterium]
MKRILGFLLMFALFFGLVACGGDDTVPTAPTGNTASITGIAPATVTVGDAFDPLTGITATDTVNGDITSSITVTGALNLNSAGNYILTYKVTGSDGKLVSVTRTITVLTAAGCPVNQEKVNGICVPIPPTTIVIMHGAPYEVNPFHANFSGTEQLERQQKQLEVEQRLNVKIEYRAYPSNAAWGPDRVTAIIQSSVAGAHLADIYWSVSDWIQTLAKGDAIVPVDKYLTTTGANIHSSYKEVGSFQEQVYGFGAGKLTVDTGLYYNAELVASLGVDNPTDLFLAGQWTWSKFDQWATQVQTALTAQGDDKYALGGIVALYAENMIPLNGGSLINATTKRVAFAQNPALETYAFLSSLYTKGLFELSPLYDAGSPQWQAGKVAMHPGNLWFVNAENRWGGLAFELGFVPFPRSNTYTGDYVSPVAGVAVYHIASGMTPAKEALVFQVWNELQIWQTDAQMELSFELSLMTKFDQEKYVEAYLAIYDKVYRDLINAVGISAYGENGWRRNANIAIREGNARTVMDQIKPIYEAALETYLNG